MLILHLHSSIDFLVKVVNHNLVSDTRLPKNCSVLSGFCNNWESCLLQFVLRLFCLSLIGALFLAQHCPCANINLFLFCL